MSEKGAIIELITLLNLGRADDLAEKLEEMAVQDIAEAMSQAEPADRLRILRALPEERRTDTFSYLSHGLQREVIAELNPGEARRILRELVPDDRTAFLESLDPQELEGFLKLLGPEDLKQSLKLLGYPEESVASSRCFHNGRWPARSTTFATRPTVAKPSTSCLLRTTGANCSTPYA